MKTIIFVIMLFALSNNFKLKKNINTKKPSQTSTISGGHTLGFNPNGELTKTLEKIVVPTEKPSFLNDSREHLDINNKPQEPVTEPENVQSLNIIPDISDKRVSEEEKNSGYKQVPPQQTQEPEQPVVTQEPEQPVVTQEPEQPAVTQEPEQPAVTQEPEQPVVTQEPEQPAVTQEPEQKAVTQEPTVAADNTQTENTQIKPEEPNTNNDVNSDIGQIVVNSVLKASDVSNYKQVAQDSANATAEELNKKIPEIEIKHDVEAADAFVKHVAETSAKVAVDNTTSQLAEQIAAITSTATAANVANESAKIGVEVANEKLHNQEVTTEDLIEKMKEHATDEVITNTANKIADKVAEEYKQKMDKITFDSKSLGKMAQKDLSPENVTVTCTTEVSPSVQSNLRK